MQPSHIHNWCVVQTIPNGSFNATNSYSFTVQTPLELVNSGVRWMRLRSFDSWGTAFAPNAYLSRTLLRMNIPTADTETSINGSLGYCSFFACNSFATSVVQPTTSWLPLTGEWVPVNTTITIDSSSIPLKSALPATDIAVMMQFEWSTSFEKPIEV